MKIFYVVLISSSFLTVSCITRAPSNYELDRQAGRLPKQGLRSYETPEIQNVYQIKGENKVTTEPLRIEPRTEKVWVYDQETEGGYFLQGTYLYFQVDSGHWISPGDEKL